jgi:hypothetical protein
MSVFYKNLYSKLASDVALNKAPTVSFDQALKQRIEQFINETTTSLSALHTGTYVETADPVEAALVKTEAVIAQGATDLRATL